MKKLEEEVYNRLLAQAEEAKEQGKYKLATCILHSIGAHPDDAPTEYSFSQLEEDIRTDTWKLATNLITYYGVKNVDAEKLDEAIIASAEKLAMELESALGIEPGTVGSLEPKLPGENK